MTMSDSSASKGPAPAPEEVGAMYDRFGDLLAMVLGRSALHVGMFVPHDERTAAASLLGLSDLAQDRQTEFLADLLADVLPPSPACSTSAAAPAAPPSTWPGAPAAGSPASPSAGNSWPAAGNG